MNKDIVQEFYYLALADLAHGSSIRELESAIKYYQEVEDYEACAGILKAIDEVRHDTIDSINKRLYELRNNKNNSRDNNKPKDR